MPLERIEHEPVLGSELPLVAEQEQSDAVQVLVCQSLAVRMHAKRSGRGIVDAATEQQ